MTPIIHRLALAMAALGGLALALIVAVTATNTGAFMLDRLAGLWGGDVAGLPGYEECVQLATGAAALMFLPWCQAERGHVAVSLFDRALPPGLRRALDRLWLALTAAVALFLALWLTRGMVQMRSDQAITPVLGWAIWPFMAPGIAALGLWAAVALDQMRGPIGDRMEDATDG